MLLCLWVWWSAGVAHYGVAGAADSPGFPVCSAGRVNCYVLPGFRSRPLLDPC